MTNNTSSLLSQQKVVISKKVSKKSFALDPQIKSEASYRD